ncbi:MAG: efflux RND transporter periplasmic adaptor subunit, partial [Candidatus Rokubacteria bacterium]|nr:efflux RND transporter periplasmic adaptor subunit [Candidatus Rokubacteria bacterium]
MLTPRSARTPETALGRCLVGIALLVLIAGCQRQGGGQEPKQAAAEPAPTVIVLEVPQRTVQVSSEFVARTEAIPTVEIRARIVGVLEQVRFREGSEVRRGQVLFVIQQDEYKAAVQTARAQLAKAQADLTRARDTSVVDRARAQLDQAKAELGKSQADVARYRPLAREKAIPQQDLDTAVSREQVAAAGVEAAEAALKDTVLGQRTAIELGEAAVEAAKAAVTQADLNLAYTVVESPITGIVGQLMVDPGNLVGKGEPTLLATVSTIHPIFVDFSIAEVDYLHLVRRVPGLGRGEVPRERAPSLELILADGSVFPHKGRPIFIGREIDLKTGTIQVRSEFPNPQWLLRPGQFGRVRAVTEEVPNAVLVPQIAVQELQGAKTVLVVGEGDKVALRTVTLREPYDQYYIVSAGLKPGERVIVEGIQKARPGMQVKPELRAAADAKPVPDKTRAPTTPPPPAPPAPKAKSSR